MDLEPQQAGIGQAQYAESEIQQGNAEGKKSQKGQQIEQRRIRQEKYREIAFGKAPQADAETEYSQLEKSLPDLFFLQQKQAGCNGQQAQE